MDKRRLKVPPKFSELKIQANRLETIKERLNFWIEQRKAYIQEFSWKWKEVDVFDISNIL